jgi:hypothetical protein
MVSRLVRHLTGVSVAYLLHNAARGEIGDAPSEGCISGSVLYASEHRSRQLPLPLRQCS